MFTSLVALLAAAPADAQALTWVLQPGAVLSPDPAIPYMSQSIANPTVVWDSVHNRFVMLFESRTSSTDPDCPAGIWAVGMATSPDGFVWTPEPSPVLEPDPASSTYWKCVAAHPTALFDPAGAGGNGMLLVWFKAEQGTNCPTPAPSWGCNNAVGLGRANVYFTASGSVGNVLVRPDPVWNANGKSFGYPKVVKDGSTYHLLMQIYPDIHGATTQFPNALLTFRPRMRLTDAQQFVTWAQNELFNPSAICDDSASFPGAAWVGGRDTNGAAVIEGAWSKAMFDPSTNSWLYDTVAQQSWTNSNEWRHWDHHKLDEAVHGPNQYVVWFDEKDPTTGNNFIRIGGTTLTFSGADLVSKTCP